MQPALGRREVHLRHVALASKVRKGGMTAVAAQGRPAVHREAVLHADAIKTIADLRPAALAAAEALRTLSVSEENSARRIRGG